VSTFEAISTSPIIWIADQLERMPPQPGRRAVVLVAAERLAHAIRRHVCIERAHPESLAGVLFWRPVDLAREVLVRSGSVRTTGWEPVRRLRILHVFESGALADQLRYFSAEQLRSGQGYVDAFAHTIADLEAAGLDAPLALSIAGRLASEDRLAADRLHDVAVTWQTVDTGALPRVTTPQLLTEAVAVLREHPMVLAPLGSIFAALTASSSTALLRFLRALPACRVVFQDVRPLRTGTQLWRSLLSPQVPAEMSPQRSSSPESELQLVQRFLFELPETLTDPQRPRSRGPDGSVDVEEYPSIEDEIEAAATWVTEQIAAGIALEQIGLIVPEVDAYGPLLVDRLSRIAAQGGEQGIHVSVAGGLSLAASPAGVRLQALLHALARGLDAEATIRVLPALRRHNQGNEEARERLSPSRAAEVVYGAGIVGGSPRDRAGLREWEPRLARRCAALRQLIDEAAAESAPHSTDEPEKRLDVRARHDAARWLRDVEPLLPAIAALQQLADTILAGAALRTTWQHLGEFCERWLRVPPAPPNLFAVLERSLKPVLDDPAATAVSGAAALRFLMAVLRRERQPTARFGTPCVFVGTAAQAAGLPFAAVRILGLAEGALPQTPHDDPIVPDNLRQRIEPAARAQQSQPTPPAATPPQADIVLPRLADHVLDDIHDVFRVVSGTTCRLALSAPRQWVDRSEREVSGIMLEVATALGRTLGDGADEGDVPTAARLRAAYLNAGRGARRAYAAAHPLSPRALFATAPASARDAVVVPAAWVDGAALAIDGLWQLTAALEGDGLSGMDGVVTDAWPAVQPPGLIPQRPISASALTRLLECPHRFLLERVLYLNEPTVRPATDVIAPSVYGSLFHAAAERFFREAGAALCRHEGTIEGWVNRAQEIGAEEFEQLLHVYPMRGEGGIARERDRLLRQIEQLVRYEWLLPVREFLDSELTFGDPEPVRLALDNGDLYVRGAIDRIDRLDPGALSVRDLKTGRVRDFGEDAINAGRDLQIGLYTLALEATGYAAGGRVTAAAYVHPSAAQEPDRAFTGSNMDVLRRRTREWLALARELLSRGAFPRTPHVADCAYCPFVPACGDGAQRRSAAKLERVAPEHPLSTFLRFKRQRIEGEG
jgi:RecB family exonuclease